MNTLITNGTVVNATGAAQTDVPIDAHTHMQMPFGGTYASITFETGTRAAATTIIDFALQK